MGSGAHFYSDERACRVEHAVMRWLVPPEDHGIEFVTAANIRTLELSDLASCTLQ